MSDAFREGIELFNARKYFECHEALETLWLKAQGEEKTFLHGLIQAAVAFHHFTLGNMAGARSVLEKSLKKFAKCGEVRNGIDLASLCAQLELWRGYLDFKAEEREGRPAGPPELPIVRWCGK